MGCRGRGLSLFNRLRVQCGREFDRLPADGLRVRSANVTIMHLVTSDMSEVRCRALEAVWRGVGEGHARTIMQLGAGPGPSVDAPVAARVHVPVALSGVRRAALRRVLARCGAGGEPGVIILHAWTAAAAEWGLTLAATHRPVVLEVDAGDKLEPIARWAARSTLSLVCRSATTRARLLGLGLPAARCALVRSAVELAPEDGGRRAAARERLGLAAGDVAVAVLPPATRGSGAYVGAWAALLLEKVRPEVRVMLPEGGREAARVRRLVQACRHEWMACHVSRVMAVADLVCAADLGVYLPAGDAPQESVLAAMAAECPLVVSDVPAMRELLTAGRSAWFCGANDPEAAARCMLRALECDEQSRRQAAEARGVAAVIGGRDRMVRQYAELYANLASRRPAVRVAGA